jgi:hypothetical protein
MLFEVLTTLVTIAILVFALYYSSKYIPKNDDHRDVDIPRFKTDVFFEPYPSTVNIENRYDCNVKSLRVCDINDPTTLFGCKELTVRCHHFDKDTPYMVQGDATIIPKNKSSTEGYALAITDITKSCNPYHGDLVLIASNKDSTEYMLICSCKNAGYIGNENLLGSCETVFVCNGKIDDINQPLEKINCQCPPEKNSERNKIDNVPYCATMKVTAANSRYSDWTHLVRWINDRQIPISAYDRTIAGNLNVKYLLNPCRNSLIDPTQEIQQGSYDYYRKFCKFIDYGIPVKVNILNTNAVADAALPSDRYQFLRFTDNIGGKRGLAAVKTRINFDPRYSTRVVYAALPEGITVGGLSQVWLNTKQSFVAPRCVGDWPTYSCKMSEYFAWMVYGLPVPGSRPCPGEFLWGQEFWNNVETLAKRGVKISESKGLELNQSVLKSVDSAKIFGVIYQNVQDGNAYGGFLSFKDYNDFKLHKNSIT